MAEVFREPLTAECLAMYVESLTDLSDEQIRICIGRAIRELKWFPKPAELLELAGANPAQQQDAEARKAWEVVVEFVQKWVASDVYGNYVITRGVRSSEPPKLAQRILDSVRRSGGWRAYKCMTNDDFPFQQKRFIEAYLAWTAVEQVPTTKLLNEMPRLRLVSKAIDQREPEAPAAETKPSALTAQFKPKPIPSPLTDAQLRDRREMLKQQAAAWAAKKNGAAATADDHSGTDLPSAGRMS